MMSMLMSPHHVVDERVSPKSPPIHSFSPDSRSWTMGTFAQRNFYYFSLAAFLIAGPVRSQGTIDVDAQPLAANVRRLLQALDNLGAPLSDVARKSVLAACANRDVGAIQ